MKIAFKLMSFCWVISPLVFTVLRVANVVNVEKQNVTIFLVLAGISYVALFLNSGDMK